MRKLKQVLREELKNVGISAEDAGVWSLGGLVEENKLYISLRRAGVTPGAMCGYLGQDSDGNEIYGMALDVKFALVLLSPRENGGYGAELFAEETLNALMASAKNLGVQEIVCAEAAYDSLRDCFRQEMVVANQMMAYGVKTDTGVVLEHFRIQALVQ